MIDIGHGDYLLGLWCGFKDDPPSMIKGVIVRRGVLWTTRVEYRSAPLDPIVDSFKVWPHETEQDAEDQMNRLFADFMNKGLISRIAWLECRTDNKNEIDRKLDLVPWARGYKTWG